MSRIEPIKPAARFKNPLRTRRNSVIAAVVIIAASVSAINFAIKHLSGAHEYLVAASSAAEGTAMNEVQTETISLNLGAGGDDYLAPNDKTDGLTLAAPTKPGELILKRDLVAADPDQQMVRLAIVSKTALPSKLEAGTAVDLWAATNDGAGVFGDPALIAQNVQVFSTNSATAIFGENSNKLELAVRQRDVKPILSAVLHSDAISVVSKD